MSRFPATMIDETPASTHPLFGGSGSRSPTERPSRRREHPCVRKGDGERCYPHARAGVPLTPGFAARLPGIMKCF